MNHLYGILEIFFKSSSRAKRLERSFNRQIEKMSCTKRNECAIVCPEKATLAGNSELKSVRECERNYQNGQVNDSGY